MAKQETSVALCFMLSEVTGIPVTEVGPLSDHVGTEALDSLFTKSGTRWLHNGISVKFNYDGIDVTVRSDGEVTFFSPREATALR
jgi:hypothetical protein